MTDCLERLKYFLNENSVPYEVQHHREVFTMQEVAAELHEGGAHVAKVVIAWADGKLAMLVLPATAHVDFDRAAKMLNVRHARRAREDEFKFKFPDCDVGAMPPFGNLYEVPVYLDHSLTREQPIVFQAGSHRDTLKIALADYRRLASPTIGDFSVQPESAPAGA